MGGLGGASQVATRAAFIPTAEGQERIIDICMAFYDKPKLHHRRNHFSLDAADGLIPHSGAETLGIMKEF